MHNNIDGEQHMKRLILLAATFAVLISLAARSFAQHTGMQAIGLSNYNQSTMNNLLSDLMSLNGKVEISFLPFNFDPRKQFNLNNPFEADNPFLNANTILESALPHMRGELVLTVCLSNKGDMNWGSYRTGRSQYLNSSGYLKCVHQFDDWVKYARGWAAANYLSGAFHIVCVPMLEDDCPDAALYSALISDISKYQQGEGVSVAFRRSFDGGYYYRVGNLPLEFHGGNVGLPISSGDVFSNDGAIKPILSATDFISIQHGLLGQGVTCLWWRPEWNGNSPDGTKNGDPSSRQNLNPLSSSSINSELVRVLNSR